MSLIDSFARSTLCLGLAAEQLHGALRRRGRFELPFQQAVLNPEGAWQPVLTAARGCFQQAGRAPHGTRMAVTLSSRWCRMLTVPWSDALLNDSQATRFLKTQFMSLYGDAARDWTFTSDNASYGRPRLACGIESDLLQSLHDLAAENRLELSAVESVLPVAWRAIAAAGGGLGGGGPRAFAVVEAGRMSLATVAGGRINAVHAQPCGRTWHKDLPPAWQRWVLRAPELDGIGQISVLNLTGEAKPGELPPSFKDVALPDHGLAPGFMFVTCNRGW